MSVWLLWERKKLYYRFINNEIKIVLNALNEFRNKILEQGRYTEPVDELILKLNKYIWTD